MEYIVRKLKVLDLFSGIGGFSLGLDRTGGFDTVAFCEIEEFPRKVLSKHWPDVPIFRDIRKLKGEDVGSVDVICGGYPCQPFSTAGRRKGKEDDRHLWPEFSRLVDELRPSWVIGENVAGHISMGLDDVLSDLENKGYTCRTFVIPACAVDAPHRRDRVWIVANACVGRCGQPGKGQDKQPRGAEVVGASEDVANANGAYTNAKSAGQSEMLQPRGRLSQQSGGMGGRESMANADSKGSQGRQKTGSSRKERAWGNQLAKRRIDMPRAAWKPESELGGMVDGLPAWVDGYCRWPAEPDIGRVANGVPNRTNRLKALGNAVVPQIPEMIGRAIMGTYK